MALVLDHFFILTDAPDKLASLIAGIGLVEGSSNSHPGQGTANRRFFLPNSTLEILYLRDVAEAQTGPGRDLGFAERLPSDSASPFGLVFAGTAETSSPPFSGWRYFPDYLTGDTHFHVGNNSNLLEEPLCIVMPPGLTRAPVPTAQQNADWTLTKLQLQVSVFHPSATLLTATAIPGVWMQTGLPHQLDIVFNDHARGESLNLTPEFPLCLLW